MKKFVKIAALMMIISCALMNTEKADAKTVSVNKTNVTVNVGSTTKVKVKNAKKVKVKISKKVAKVSVSGKTIKIKGIKAGKATVSVKASKMKTKKIKVTVKVKIKNTEASVRAKIDGYGDKYKSNIETYPYLDKKSYSKTSEIYRYSLNEQWKAMPDYLRDCLAYNKAKIYFDLNMGVEGRMTGYDKMVLRNYKNKYKENIAIIHEAAHAYDFFMDDNYDVDVKKSVKTDYKNNKYKYGPYGANDLKEFYAESIENSIICKLRTISDEYIVRTGVENVKSIDIDIREGSSRHPGGKYVTVTINWPGVAIVDLNDIVYANGMVFKDWETHKKEVLKSYYQTIYPDATSIRIC